MSTQANSLNASIFDQNNVLIGQCSHDPDHELLSAARSGDCEAFAELCERHSRKILPRIYRITRNREDAEDAFQDALLRAFLHLNKFEGRASFSSWLTKIASNSALMVLRKRRGQEIPLDQPPDDTQNWRPSELCDPSETPEARYARRETEELLKSAIHRLPSIFREVVELQQARECSTNEIALALGISVSAVKSRLMRARIALRRLSHTRRWAPLKSR